MHVAFVITRSDAMGGASVHVRDTATALIRAGHHATVLVGGKGGDVTDRLAEARVPFLTIPTLGRAIHPVRDAAAVFALRSKLNRLQPDLVSTHTAKAGLVGRIAAASLRLPVLYTPHGWSIADRISPLGGRLFRIAERMASPLATRIVNVCEAERELALAHDIAPHERMDVVHNGVVDVPVSLRANPAQHPPRIVMVARFEAPKDHETLLLALARLVHLPWNLDLVGGGPLQTHTRGVVGRLGLAPRVNFQNDTEPVANTLAASQIFVLASRSEGFPRSILEAMRAGLPVVTSDVGGASEAVQHGRTGIVVPRSDVQAMAAALEMLLRSAGLRQRFGAMGRQRYETHFTFDRMFEKTMAVYRATITGKQVLAAAGETVSVNSIRRVS